MSLTDAQNSVVTELTNAFETFNARLKTETEGRLAAEAVANATCEELARVRREFTNYKASHPDTPV